MTAHAMAEDIKKSHAAGMDAHITKPINPTLLLQTLATWIEPSRHPAPVPSNTKSAELPMLDNLAGIDVKAGLATVQGNSDLYLKLLLKFRDSEQDFGSQFRAAQMSEDSQAAARLAHTLAGVAGNLGAKDVATAARGLEQGCRKPAADQDLGILVRRVVEALQVVLTGLTVLPHTRTSPASPSQASEADPVLLLHELRAFLEKDDTDAIRIAEQLQTSIGASQYGSIIEKLTGAIRNYQFGEALQHWRELNSLIRPV
jgi:HPt (histidine-containing phosphotransfer) domain-containing protein